MFASDLEISGLTADEVLSDRYCIATATPDDIVRSKQRLERWCDVAADGDWSIFQKRLQRDGIDLDDVRGRFAKVDRRPGVPEPFWVRQAQDVSNLLKQGCRSRNSALEEQPFGTLLEPLIRSSLDELRERCETADSHLVAVEALADMARQLWQRLTELCGLPLYRSLLRWKQSIAATYIEGKPTDDQYSFDQFVEFMCEHGWDALLKEYPILPRQIALARQQWLNVFSEFLHRLQEDREALCTVAPGVYKSSVLTRVLYGVSDPHEGGRAVLIVTFDHGQRVVYKPKDLSADRAVETVLTFLNERGFSFPLRIPRSLTRGDYGWTEFIEPAVCKVEEDISEYYHRAGAWLGLFYLLSTSDMHMENLVATGADPIPVDLETIFQGLSRKPAVVGPGTEGAWSVNAYLERSVLTVGLLPGYVRGDNEALVSVGGLEPSTVRTKRVTWLDQNTLSMRPEIIEETKTVSSNLPQFGGHFVKMDLHRTRFVEGFRATLDFVMCHRAVLAEFIEQVANRNLLVRRVVRPTRFYYMLLRRLSDHRRMSDSILWSLEAEFIARLYDWDSDAVEPWKLFSNERLSLTEFTIPAFHVAAARSVICCSHREITNLHLESGAAISVQRIRALSQTEVETQVRIVMTALQMNSNGGENETAQKSIRKREEKALATDKPANLSNLADRIGKHLRDRSFRTEEAAAWLALEYVDHQTSTQIVPMGHDLYNGSCGVAVFLAALARTRRSDEAASLAKASIAHVRAVLHSVNRARLVRSLGLGGAVGFGSIVYGLTTVGNLLDDGEIIQTALLAAETVTSEAIASDDRFDLVAGVAGMCLALLKLHRLTGEKTVLDKAVRCADHLELNRPIDRSPWSSSVFKQQPLTGISHGAAGYALAFSRLYAATGDKRYHKIVNECVAFENSFFDESRRTWPDLRRNSDSGQLGWPVQWCYGATGIGYSRLAMANDGALAQSIAMEDVRRSVSATLDVNPRTNDTLCCGTAGHASFLSAAGNFLNDSAVSQAAANQMRMISEDWSQNGDVRWDMGTSEFNLGLYRGVAGIGYAALEIENPALPRILVWE